MEAAALTLSSGKLKSSWGPTFFITGHTSGLPFGILVI